MGKHSQYGVILDAGSSGTRVYVYKWKNPANAREDADDDDLSALPELKLKQQKKIHPGVSTFAEDVAAVGPSHLQELIDIAIDEVPKKKIPETPIFLMATAGVRLLPKNQQTALLQGICNWLQTNTQFSLPDCDAHIQVISGETEGLYGWIAANYLLGGFDRPELHRHGKGHHTYGFLDMGGASAQIAFAPNSTQAEKHSNDLKLVRLRKLDGSPSEYKVFTATWLGFGANQARERYVTSLVDTYGKDALELPDPCMPKGLQTGLDGKAVLPGTDPKTTILTGTGAFEECLRKTYPLLGKDTPCDDEPCLLNGQHVPAIDFDVNHFVGVSEYWHTTHGVFGGKQKAYDLATYQQNVVDFCGRDWTDINNDFDKRKKTKAEKMEDAQEACFKASWLINMLYEGIGVPRIGLEDGSNNGVNGTEEALESAKNNGFVESFKPVDKIDGIELSWTLGKMVLYAAGQVPASETPLPVGFGSNDESGFPADFEYAGSNPVLPISDHDDDDDFEDVLQKHSRPWGLVVLLLLLVAIGYVLRKPERRRRLVYFATRRTKRPGGGRKSNGVLSLTNKLFGRNSPTYERILEEGDAPQFELGEVDSEDTEHSDGSDGSIASRSSAIDVSKLRSEDLKLPPAIDRTGLTVRNESREHLAPTVQMLNAGRRSRNGSPTRQKPSLMTPMQED